uniref:Protein kinase domain-containing protein n=1 Tax=Physcomitrium patens TaxID=3218 RepID=A0A2K1L8S0_PHYPA|nr:MAP3K epsilon protein kinase 2-like [Physcomitrium patens]PNR62436.1 hypothetical protein PHYPA_000860 [Physcomitrium patens]|eukprot:XP_024372428.1 MAP3K epsilon protein kinase 2-like [Physcomitrella patens]
MAGAMAGCGAVARSWIRGNLIGAGAFGKVNLAVNREDGEVFAVKSVRVEEGSGDAGAQVSLQALENEIEILQSLESKFVVRCLGSDWTEEGGKLMRNAYLEYMPEGCLTDFVRQFAGAGSEPLDEHLIRTYTRSIVEGVDYLHRQGIVHCDIKGKNILVGNGSVKLTDFGSAKRVGAEGRVCGNGSGGSLGRLNGTPLWMAPEVVRQDEQGLASDIWSLGCTVLEMATGKAPWSHLANPFVAMFQIGYKDEIPAVPASLSSEAKDFLRRCFERDPRKRWTSGELLEHPFLTTRHVAKKVEVEVGEAERRECDGRLVEEMKETVPILRMPSFLKRGLVTEGKVEESVGSRGYSSSPFAMPMEGEWIVVRSPSESPRSGSPSRGQRSVSTASSNQEEEIVAGCGMSIDLGEELCLKNKASSTIIRFDTLEECQYGCSIVYDLTEEGCPVETNVSCSLISTCTDDNDGKWIESEEALLYCEYGGFRAKKVDGSTLSGLKFAFDVEMVDKVPNPTPEAGHDLVQQSLVATTDISNLKCFSKLECLALAGRRKHSYGLEVSEMEESIFPSLGVIVQMALFFWPASFGADGQVCGENRGWINVDTSHVNTEEQVLRNYCTVLIRCNVNGFLKMWNIPSHPLPFWLRCVLEICDMLFCTLVLIVTLNGAFIGFRHGYNFVIHCVCVG